MKVIWESSSSCIEKEISTEGNFSKKPTERSACRVKIDNINFQGLPIGDKSIDEIFHSEYLKDPSEEKILRIGDANSKIDEYIERIIQTMFTKEESLARIKLPYPDEPSGSDIVSFDFKMNLLACDFYKPIWEWTAMEKYDIALSYKEVGVVLYKSMRIVEAFYKFSRACKILITLEPIEDREIDEALKKDVENLRKILYNNMAECHLIRKNYDHAISLCDKVLRIDEKNVKALYRKALANENLKDYENAMGYMEKVVVLEPRNSAAKEKLVIYKKKVYEAKKKYDNIVKKMFPS